MQAFHSILRSTAATSFIEIEFKSLKDQKRQEIFNLLNTNLEGKTLTLVLFLEK